MNVSRDDESDIDHRTPQDTQDKRQVEWSFIAGRLGSTYGEREDERDAVSLARLGGLTRVASQQRLPAEGVGAAGGDVRDLFDQLAEQASAPPPDAAVGRVSEPEAEGAQATQGAREVDEARC